MRRDIYHLFSNAHITVNPSQYIIQQESCLRRVYNIVETRYIN